MNFLHTLRHRLSESLHHHPATRFDPLLGKLEQVGPSLWRTTEPIQLLETLPPITVTLDNDAPARETFEQLRTRYPGLKVSIGQLLCKAAPRVRTKLLWQHASLASLEIWRNPATAAPVLALQYQLDDDPEYTYIVRLENWRPIDVLVVG